jgi:predicted ArsR family transcriptional regulator
MTEAPAEGAAAEESGRRGRPRPQDTIDRDEQVYQLLTKGALSRVEIAEKLGIEPKAAYLSLFRLKRDGYVKRTQGAKGDAKSNTWEAVSASD